MNPVLIFRIGSLGDTVVALPCFHLIERSFPGARRILVTDTPASQKAAPVASVLGDSGLIDEVIYFPPPPRTFSDLGRLGRDLKRTGADTLIYVADRPLASTIRDLAFFRLAGVRRIIGSPISPGLRRPRVDPATGEWEHEAERLVRCLAELGPVDLADHASWDLRLSQQERDAAARALAPLAERPFIALSAGGKVAAKDWGDENWSELLGALAREAPHMATVFFGSFDEAKRLDRLGAAGGQVTLNLAGRLSPRESAAALSRAQLFVGHDSGPLHLAAATATPCVGVFGDFNRPRWWHPMGPGHRIIHDMAGVKAITPNQVLEAVRASLGEGRPAKPRSRLALA